MGGKQDTYFFKDSRVSVDEDRGVRGKLIKNVSKYFLYVDLTLINSLNIMMVCNEYFYLDKRV